MHCVNTATPCHREELVCVEVSIDWRAAVEWICLVCKVHVEGICVLIGIYRDRGDLTVRASANYSHCDLWVNCFFRAGCLLVMLPGWLVLLRLRWGCGSRVLSEVFSNCIAVRSTG